MFKVRIRQPLIVAALLTMSLFLTPSCTPKGDLIIVNMLGKDVNVHRFVMLNGFKSSTNLGVCPAHSTKVFHKELYPSSDDYTDLNNHKIECNIQYYACSDEYCVAVVLSSK